jgi:hypothetical protein
MPAVQVVSEDLVRLFGEGSLDQQSAQRSLETVAVSIKGITRGNGFAIDNPISQAIICEEDLAGVIISASARLVSNPAQFKREEISGYSAVGGSRDSPWLRVW